VGISLKVAGLCHFSSSHKCLKRMERKNGTGQSWNDANEGETEVFGTLHDNFNMYYRAMFSADEKGRKRCK
jgi:outer membrane receptor for ferric coprogen and ferric-rhodotorulic acid